VTAFTFTPPRDLSFYGDARKHGALCNICPLQGSQIVPYSPPAEGRKLKLILVGEGPGRREELEKKPFVGPTGRRLDEELGDVGLDRDAMWVTNAALCSSDNDKDNERAAECCAPRLLRELAALPADVPIVPLGKAATRSVLGVKSILLARGFVWTARDLTDSIKSAEAGLRKAQREGAKKVARLRDAKIREAKLRLEVLTWRHKLAGRTVLPTLHPTFAFIHNEAWQPIFSVDFIRIARWVKGELTADMLADNVRRVNSLKELAETERTFVVTDSVDDIDAVSAMLGPEVALDIETERMKPLNPLAVPVLCVQISDGKRGLVIAPWESARHAAALTRLIKGRTVIMHNGYCFDSVVLSRPDVGVSFEGVNIEDTLTAHHAFASVYPQRLDHVVGTFLDSSPWKIKFGVRGAEEKGLAPAHGEVDELFEYGAVDAFVTKLAWDAMQNDLEPERSVYEFDKRRSLLYRSLQVVGYPVDRRRRALLSKLLKRRAAALKGRLRRIAHKPHFQPSKLADVRKVLFGTLKAPLLNPTATGLAGTSNATLESLRTGDLRGEGTSDKTRATRIGHFCETLLNWRVTLKCKNTYVDTVPVSPRDGRAHYNFKPFGVWTGRPGSRILSAPRWSKALPERFREIFCAGPGRIIVYFDLAQAEGRAAANLSGDPNFIAACAKDLHTKNALILFPAAKEKLERDPKGKNCPRHSSSGNARAACDCGKPFRDVTKNAGFAIIYQAAVAKVFTYLRSQGFPVELGDVEAMFSAMRETYQTHQMWVETLLRFVEQNGYMRTALKGRLMRYGFHPKPTDVSNCLDEETEALTPDGWVRGPDLKPGQKLLTKNIETGLLTWEPISRMTRIRRPGPLYKFESTTFNAVSTPDHRWLVHDRRRGIDRCATTEELAKGTGELSIHRTGTYEGSTAPLYSDDFVELVRWVLTDGTMQPGLVALYQTKKHNVRRIDALIRRLGVYRNRKVRKHGNVVWRMFSSDPVVGLLHELFPDRTLSPAFLRALTPKQLRLLLDTMMRGDGCIEPGRKGRFTCRDKARADMFQMLCTFCGIATTAHWRGPGQPKKQYPTLDNRPKSSGCWIVDLLQRDTAQVLRHPQRYGKHKKRVDQIRRVKERPVWCPTVRNTYFVARRKGDVYITGNCPVQSLIADVMDTRLLDEIVPGLPGDTKMILHHYDSASFDMSLKWLDWKTDGKGNKLPTGPLIELIEHVWAQPVHLEPSIVCPKGADFLLPAEVKVGKRWSEL
jgi:uracil-DNA glycosylase family 4